MAFRPHEIANSTHFWIISYHHFVSLTLCIFSPLLTNCIMIRQAPHGFVSSRLQPNTEIKLEGSYLNHGLQARSYRFPGDSILPMRPLTLPNASF